MNEPLLHTGITDTLPDAHPLAWTAVGCDNVSCSELLHASNNENMRGWVETGRGNYCLRCFQIIEETEDIEPYALRDGAP